MSLDGKVIWVTGAGSGIGRATAIAFGRAGARVALTGRREDALAETAAAMPGGAAIVPADLSDPAAITRAHDAVIAALGPVEVLVNNAGSNAPGRHWKDLTADAMTSVLEVNLHAPFLCTMAVLPAMRANGGGTLIHIASVAAVMLFPPSGAAYGASKVGVQQMSGHLNAEEGVNGIRSICIHPGEVATDILNRRPVPPTAAERALMLQAEDVAAAAVFVASLPPRATVADLTIVPTDNQFWRPFAQALHGKRPAAAEGDAHGG